MQIKKQISEMTMGKTLKIVSLFILSIAIVMGAAESADAKKKKKKFEITEAEHALLDKWEAKKTEKSRKKTVKKLRKVLKKKVKYVGATKCNGSCHDPYYEAWKESPHGGTYNLLKPGERIRGQGHGQSLTLRRTTPQPHYVYGAIPQGYKQRGGFKPAGSKNKKGKDTSSTIDPDEPNKEQVGCEMCHSVAGGSHFRAVMKASKGKFDKGDTEKYGQRWDYANVCTRCHTHPNTPFKPSVHDKYKFNFEERKKKVHLAADFYNEDNMDQKLEKAKDRAKEVSQSEKTPLIIEDFEIKKGKLKFKKGTKPYNKKKKSFNYKK